VHDGFCARSDRRRQFTTRSFHDPGVALVNCIVTRFAFIVSLAFAALPVAGADANLAKMLKGVEERYNRAKTLKVTFSQIYTQGNSKRAESGELLLRKPGRMRWTYANPAGKLFTSDGKNVYLYSPATNRVDKMKLKETEDMRAPLAFLLGRLDFSRDFTEFQSKTEGSDTVVSALPKSDKLPYAKVSFAVSQDLEIRRLIVHGQDQSILEFRFTGEILNPKLDDKIFHFQAPKGAEIVDETGQD
jgi:outer membrane lipoprotein carrier protein